MPRPLALPRLLRLVVALVALSLGGLFAANWLSRSSSPSPPVPLTVLAASSLTDVLPKVAAAWTAGGHPDVSFRFDSSAKLAKQIEAGAPADVYVSADTAWMDHLVARDLVVSGTRVRLLGNVLVVIVAARSPLSILAPVDLGLPGVKHLALAGEFVPAGAYGREALAHQWAVVKDRVVEGDNVRTVLGWVATGEAEAGVVYATDARAEPRVRVAFQFEEGIYTPIVYPAAVVTGSVDRAEALAFLSWCAGPEARTIFAAAGFLPPPAS